jgi:hypothetical protein
MRAGVRFDSMNFKTAVGLAVAFSLATTTAAMAKVSGDQLKTIVSKAKIFRSDFPLQVSVDGAIAILRTYRAEPWTDNDCKINAILASKSVFEADSTVARVQVYFFDMRDPSIYDEVGVTLGDVTAYAAGQISHEQLLAGIQIGKHANALPWASSPGTTVSATTNKISDASKTLSADPQPASASQRESTVTITGNTSPNSNGQPEQHGQPPDDSPTRVSKTHASSHSALPPPPANLSTYTNYGVTFKYPYSWAIEHPRSGNCLAQFFFKSAPNIQDSMIEVRVHAQSSTKPVELVQMPPAAIFTNGWKVVWLRSMPESMRLMFSAHHGNHHRRHYHNDEGPEQTESDSYGYGHHRQVKSDSERDQRYQKFSGVTIPATLQIGANKSVKAWQRGYWAEAVTSPKEFMRSVAFTSSPYVIQLNLISPHQDASMANAAFDQLLNQLVCAATPTHAASSGKKIK